MTQQQLDPAHIGAGLKQVSGEGMAQRMGVIGFLIPDRRWAF